jgi:hypothetical protein
MLLKLCATLHEITIELLNFSIVFFSIHYEINDKEDIVVIKKAKYTTSSQFIETVNVLSQTPKDDIMPKMTIREKHQNYNSKIHFKNFWDI